MTWGYVAVGAGTLIGGYLAGQGAKSGAQTQANASEQAAQLQNQEFQTITKQEQPFIQGGYGALNQLDYMLGIKGATGTGQRGSLLQGAPSSLFQPFNMSDWKRLSPMYNFEKQQGMQGVLNGDASNSGALSGAAQKDLIGYNQNLANTSFNNAYDLYMGQNAQLFNMYNTQQQNIYSRLSGLTNLGQNAAANLGQQGTALAGSEGQAISNVGTALGAGQVGAANAYSGMAQNLGYLPYLYSGNQTPGVSAQSGSYAAPG